MADTTAEWSFSLDTECPLCKHCFDLLHELVDNASPIEACETGTVATLNYETACPECGHEFTCEFIY